MVQAESPLVGLRMSTCHLCPPPLHPLQLCPPPSLGHSHPLPLHSLRWKSDNDLSIKQVFESYLSLMNVVTHSRFVFILPFAMQFRDSQSILLESHKGKPTYHHLATLVTDIFVLIVLLWLFCCCCRFCVWTETWNKWIGMYLTTS